MPMNMQQEKKFIRRRKQSPEYTALLNDIEELYFTKLICLTSASTTSGWICLRTMFATLCRWLSILGMENGTPSIPGRRRT